MQNTNDKTNSDEDSFDEKLLYCLFGIATVIGIVIILSSCGKQDNKSKSNNSNHNKKKVIENDSNNEIESVVTEDFGNDANQDVEKENNRVNNENPKKFHAPSCNEVRGRVKGRKNKILPSTVSSKA